MPLTYCFDIDGTICTTDCHYEDAKPFVEVIDKINKLFNSGNEIIMFTARGSGSGDDWRELTEKQLKLWGVKHHMLKMGKPPAHIFVDGRAININDFCKKNNLEMI